MIWAGNSGTPQGNTNGTCGSGTPSNTLSGASYSNSYLYTQLGQLWQGPYNGSGSYQYLYCNSSQPHQLTGLYPTGTTCSTTSGQTQTYAATYNSWGDMKTRTATGTGATTASLNYDAQDHLVRWQDNNTSSNEESYLYDSSGQRILRRSQTGSGNSGTKYTITVFGLEDHIYDGGGSSLNNKYYYSLVGHMIGVLNNSGTSFLFTDALGSVVSTISNTANSASVGGNQVYGPFGSNPYSKGTMGTTKGYTGQYNDSLTQLDYYGARYYDPFTGVFLSADEVQGNFAGMNPYNYVGDNPETNIDPNGEMYAPPPGSQPQGTPPPIGGGLGTGSSTSTSTSTGGTSSGNGFGFIIEGLEQAVQDVVKSLPANIPEDIATFGEDALVGAEDAVCPECLLIPLIVMLVNPTPLASGTLPPGQSLTLPRQNSGSQNTGPQTQPGSGGGRIPPGGAPPVAPAGEPCSFTSTTQVTTDHGKEPIGKVQVGERVLAYNSKTHKMEAEPVLHVWKHSDSDLIDLTLTTVTTSQHGQKITRKSEVVHTTSEHPFLTKEHGFVPAGKLKPGMHVLRADGSFGIVTGWKPVHATKVMYNLEVAQDHTFVVGDGQWVVHNSCGSSDYKKLRENLRKAGRPVQQGQNPHHIIPCQLATEPLINATNGTFDINAAYNGRPMWTKANRNLALGDMEPYHANAPRYAAYAKSLMDSEYQRLSATGQLNPTTAFNSLMGIINLLNGRIDTIGWFGALQGEACPLF